MDMKYVVSICVVLLKLLWIIMANDLGRSESPFLAGEQKGHAVHINQAGDGNLLVRKKIFRRKRARRKIAKDSSGIYPKMPKVCAVVNKTSNCHHRIVPIRVFAWLANTGASVKY